MSQSPYEQQPDNESNPRNSSSEQVYQNQQPAYQQQPTYQQPMYAQPMMAVVPKTPQQIAGEQAAQTSMTLGVIGIVLLLTGFGGVITLILGIIGVKKAAEAERQGVPATGGKVMGWISLIGGGLLTILAILAIGFVIIAFIAAASAGSSSTRSYLDLAYTFAPLMSLL
ncbi:DUF4190 domain-containing protein [Rothia aeria]|uniref:DUF4190 domain-containing protein n=1 Tax=Rothia aeria TaxID=172042 RepID=UPI002448B48B|nr:DUF4190 domain-containing protein [Rothia sp. RSM482]